MRVIGLSKILANGILGHLLECQGDTQSSSRSSTLDSDHGKKLYLKKNRLQHVFTETISGLLLTACSVGYPQYGRLLFLK